MMGKWEIDGGLSILMTQVAGEAMTCTLRVDMG